MNPYDLYALETAFRIREQTGGTVQVISMGPPQAKAGDQGSVCDGSGCGNTFVRPQIRRSRCAGYELYAGTGASKASGEFDLILCGRQTTDGDTAQVGPEISEWLNIPSVADVVKINKVEEDGITVSMDLPEEVEIAKVQFPCLLAVNKDIFQPRLPSYVKNDGDERA